MTTFGGQTVPPLFVSPSQFSNSPITIPTGSGPLGFGGNADVAHLVTNAGIAIPLLRNGTVTARNRNVSGTIEGDWFAPFGPTASQVVTIGDWHESPSPTVGDGFEAMFNLEDHQQIQFFSTVSVARDSQAQPFDTWIAITGTNQGLRASLNGNAQQGGGTVIATALVRVSVRNAMTQQVLASAIIRYRLNP